MAFGPPLDSAMGHSSPSASSHWPRLLNAPPAAVQEVASGTMGQVPSEASPHRRFAHGSAAPDDIA
eukprot:14517105-Alexandrium_andersonii.AAC.1